MRQKDRVRKHLKRLSGGYPRYLQAFRKAQGYYDRKARDHVACYDKDGNPR